eukprot:COSAG01_NODE_6392_length_3696_cov_19.347234_3_plen_111_part_00
MIPKNARLCCLNCLAQLVQTPWKRLNTATVLISEEGAGKSIVFQHFLAKILGPQCFLSESRADALFGTYNGCLSGKVCVVAENLQSLHSIRFDRRISCFLLMATKERKIH